MFFTAMSRDRGRDGSTDNMLNVVWDDDVGLGCVEVALHFDVSPRVFAGTINQAPVAGSLNHVTCALKVSSTAQSHGCAHL